MGKREIHFCEKCGHPTKREIPEGDTHERDVCPSCGYIAYINPINIVGTVPYLGDKVLLCRRAIEPRLGYWTLPAGHQEVQETTREGAERETEEEAGIHAEISSAPYILLDIAHADQLHLMFLARMKDESVNPGPETFEARLFSEEEIPWDKLAFNSVEKSLRLFFADLKKGSFGFHYIEKHAPGKFL